MPMADLCTISYYSMVVHSTKGSYELVKQNELKYEFKFYQYKKTKQI